MVEGDRKSNGQRGAQNQWSKWTAKPFATNSRHAIRLTPLPLTILAKRRIIPRRAVLRLVVRADVRVAGDAGVVRETFRAARHAVGAGLF